MTDSVVPLQPVSDCVDVLERLLDAARKGEITAVLVAHKTPDERIQLSWTPGSALERLGMLSIAEHAVVKEMELTSNA